jgi:hypothetical protein
MRKLMALAVSVGGGALVYSQLPEIRRYLKMKRM